MLDKFKKYLGKATRKVKKNLANMKSPIKSVIIGYFLMVVLLVITYYAMWLYQCYVGNVVMRDLLAVIQEMVGTAMIAFMTFIAGCFIDTNNNGIPDQFEEEDKNEEGRFEHHPHHGEER